jgi:hypothetical protein
MADISEAKNTKTNFVLNIFKHSRRKKRKGVDLFDYRSWDSVCGNTAD